MLSAGIGIMLLGMALCYVAVKDTFTTGVGNVVNIAEDPFSMFTALRSNFQQGASSGPAAGGSVNA
jgi:hypothetical protein